MQPAGPGLVQLLYLSRDRQAIKQALIKTIQEKVAQEAALGKNRRRLLPWWATRGGIRHLINLGTSAEAWRAKDQAMPNLLLKWTWTEAKITVGCEAEVIQKRSIKTSIATTVQVTNLKIKDCKDSSILKKARNRSEFIQMIEAQITVIISMRTVVRGFRYKIKIIEVTSKLVLTIRSTINWQLLLLYTEDFQCRE